MGGVLVDVAAEDGLRVVGFNMLAGAALAMSTSTDFIIERTVYFVLLGSIESAFAKKRSLPINAGQILCHDLMKIDKSCSLKAPRIRNRPKGQR